ncbi:MAG: MSMEG_1061 family FMN-dependent PPOX-type flavoprotein [Pseudomonadota bacterium]
MRILTSQGELDALYDQPLEPALAKETDHLTSAYRALVEASPFVVVATKGRGGLDCSPRGDKGQVVFVEDDYTLLLPDRRGNNRLDTLHNIVSCPDIGLIFLLPGKQELLRVRGTAQVVVDDALAQTYSVDGKQPKCFIKIAIGRVYFQCGRAVLRSGLWSNASPVDGLPSAGQMLKQASEDFDAETYDAALAERQKGTLY